VSHGGDGKRFELTINCWLADEACSLKPLERLKKNVALRFGKQGGPFFFFEFWLASFRGSVTGLVKPPFGQNLAKTQKILAPNGPFFL